MEALARPVPARGRLGRRPLTRELRSSRTLTRRAAASGASESRPRPTGRQQSRLLEDFDNDDGTLVDLRHDHQPRQRRHRPPPGRPGGRADRGRALPSIGRTLSANDTEGGCRLRARGNWTIATSSFWSSLPDHSGPTPDQVRWSDAIDGAAGRTTSYRPVDGSNRIEVISRGRPTRAAERWRRGDDGLAEPGRGGSLPRRTRPTEVRQPRRRRPRAAIASGGGDSYSRQGRLCVRDPDRRRRHWTTSAAADGATSGPWSAPTAWSTRPLRPGRGRRGIADKDRHRRWSLRLHGPADQRPRPPRRLPAPRAQPLTGVRAGRLAPRGLRRATSRRPPWRSRGPESPIRLSRTG